MFNILTLFLSINLLKQSTHSISLSITFIINHLLLNQHLSIMVILIYSNYLSIYLIIFYYLISMPGEFVSILFLIMLALYNYQAISAMYRYLYLYNHSISVCSISITMLTLLLFVLLIIWPFQLYKHYML